MADEMTMQAVSQDGAAPQNAATDEDLESQLAYESLMRHRRKRRRRKIIAAIIILLLVGGAGFWWWWTHREVDDDYVVPPMTDYVMLDDFSESVGGTGSLKPASQVVVTPEVEGIIAWVGVAEGQEVAQGDPILYISNDSLDKAITEAELSVRSAENGVTQAKNSLNAAYVAESQGDSSMVVECEIALEQAKLELESAEEALAQARAQADKRMVYASSAGTVVAMNAQVGAAVGASGGEGGALIQIADLSRMTITVNVNELDISNIEVGQQAKVTFSALPDVELDAWVTSIAANPGGSEGGYDYYDYGVVSYPVQLIILEPDARLKPGMTASVRIMMQYLEDVLTVPLGAITYDDEGFTALELVLDYDTMETELRRVDIIAESQTTAVIEGDVADGDMVLVSGGYLGGMDGEYYGEYYDDGYYYDDEVDMDVYASDIYYGEG